MKQLEDNLQAACVKWFRLQYPDEVLFAIPNGGSRNAIEAAKLKRTGTLAGVADLFLMRGNKFYLGAFIELKAGRNRQTEAQKHFQMMTGRKGYDYQLIRSFDEFKSYIENYIR